MLKLSISFLVVTLIISIFFLSNLFLNFHNQQLISPWIARGRSATNLWFPQKELKGNLLGIETISPPSISAHAAYFVEINSGDVLFQKNPHQKLSIASLNKIMTAIVALENLGWRKEVLISRRATEIEPDEMVLLPGEILTVEDLLYGVFLVSANDAAEALAESISGGREEFIRLMNQKAEQLQMKNTLFLNPTGLEEKKEQYSTAFDVALMSRYAIKYFPHLVDITSTVHIILPKTTAHQDYDLYSGINLLTTYPGVTGFKTGYTPQAGLTLVTLAKKGEYEVLGVLLNTENRREEARKLLNYSFHKLGENQ